MSADESSKDGIDTDAAEIIGAYLRAVAARRRPGRPRSATRIAQDLDNVEWTLSQVDPTSDPLRRLDLLQRRVELTDELDLVKLTATLPELEKRFVTVAASYSASRNISYRAWRQAGVPSSVLRRATITEPATDDISTAD